MPVDNIVPNLAIGRFSTAHSLRRLPEQAILIGQKSNSSSPTLQEE